MSEHSDDGFDRWLREEELDAALRKVCERDKTACDWHRDVDGHGMLECRTCGKVVDE